MADRSFNERQQLVQAAARQARGTDCYVAELYDDRAIIEVYGDGADVGKSFEYPYTIASDDTVTLGDPREVVRETTYRAKAVKFMDGSDTVIEGLAIPFGGPMAGKDFDGEDFGPDTDFALDWFPNGRPVIYHHGLNDSTKTALQGRQVEHQELPEGIWAKVELDKSAKYHATVSKLIGQGKMFFSSGSVPHLVRATKDGHITRWPWVELSLTPTPANTFASVHPVKSTDLIERLSDAGIEPSAQLIAAALKALDATPTDDDPSLPAGLKFADHADRLLDDVEEFRSRLTGLIEVRAKSGRVLSAAVRERLLRHPASLRELAEDLDGLLAEADADKTAKTVDSAFLHQVAETLRRADDLLVPA